MRQKRYQSNMPWLPRMHLTVTTSLKSIPPYIYLQQYLLTEWIINVFNNPLTREWFVTIEDTQQTQTNAIHEDGSEIWTTAQIVLSKTHHSVWVSIHGWSFFELTLVRKDLEGWSSSIEKKLHWWWHVLAVYGSMPSSGWGMRQCWLRWALINLPVGENLKYHFENNAHLDHWYFIVWTVWENQLTWHFIFIYWWVSSNAI